MPEIQKVIQAILTSFNVTGSDRQRPSNPVVCVSSDLGSGGREVAQRLAERLEVPLYESEILKRITERLKADPNTVAVLDSGTARWRDLWLYDTLIANNMLVNDYRRQLVNVVIGVGHSGGVILGRGAHLVLAHSGALRVRTTASLPVCVERIAAREGISKEMALRRVVEDNKRRDAFLWDTFRVKVDDPANFDMIINTDRIADSEKIVNHLLSLREIVRLPTSA